MGPDQPFDDFFPIPSLSTTLSSHCTRGPWLLGACSPRSTRIGGAWLCVSVRDPVAGCAVRVPWPDGPAAGVCDCAIFVVVICRDMVLRQSRSRRFNDAARRFLSRGLGCRKHGGFESQLLFGGAASVFF